MSYWGRTANRWNATAEEKNTAASIRKDVLNAIDNSDMSKDAREMAKWMVCRVSDESLERKVRRHNAEEWFANVIASLEPGQTFTQTGLLETFDAPEEVCNYAPFILPEWAFARHLINYTNKDSNKLMSTAYTCNVYKVL